MIEVGSDPGVSRLHLRSAFSGVKAETLERLYHDALNRAPTQQLTTADHVALIRAMTLCEAEFRIPGGSVSRVMRAFGELCHRDPAAADEIAGWLVDNRGHNSYIPWGGSFSDARSLAEYREEQAERRADSERRQAKHRELQRAAAERRAERQRRQLEHVRRADAQRPARDQRVREALALQGEECVRVVTSSPVTVDYWPATVAETCANSLPDLSLEALGAFVRKLRRPRTDPWKTVRRAARAQMRAQRD
jgi:hypothetical protein